MLTGGCWHYASSISWLRIFPALICSRSWQPEPCSKPVPCGCLTPPCSRLLWVWEALALLTRGQTKSLRDITLLGCPCLLTVTAHGNGKIQPVNSESLEIPVLGEFFYRLLQRYHVLNRSCWLPCLWSRRGQERTHCDPLSQASNTLHFSARSWATTLPEDITFYRNLPCTECLMVQTNLFPLIYSEQIRNPLILLFYPFLFHPGFCS